MGLSEISEKFTNVKISSAIPWKRNEASERNYRYDEYIHNQL